MAYHYNVLHHRGITMHKLPVGGDVMGGLFAVAVVLMVLVGISIAPWFLLGAIGLGAIVSVFVIHWHRGHKIEIDDLSALIESKDKTPKA
jgi:formate-dependent nitrite reductase membrane component NrfD